jgi:anti-anti-sigma factor
VRLDDPDRRAFAERVLRPSGALDAWTSSEFLLEASRFVNRTARHAADGIVLDLSSVSFLDSSGLRALLDVRQHAQLARLRFRTTGVIPNVRDVIEIANLSDHLGL